MKTFSWIVDESNIPWLELDIKYPYGEMYEEAKAIKHLFVKHRDQDGNGGYRHKGWRSLCIHGIDSDKTNHYEQYGYKSNKETPYIWTEIANKCPVKTNFCKNTLPFNRYIRFRFMFFETVDYFNTHGI